MNATYPVAEQVQILATAIGRGLEVRTAATAADAVRARFPAGAPPALEAALLEGFTRMQADTTGLRTDTVHRLLGRRPRSFARWYQANAQASLA